MSILVGIPVKPFTVAKRRLSTMLDGDRRRRLGQAIALRTADIARSLDLDVRIVTGDVTVTDWAAAHGLATIAEEPGGGLDGAARKVAAATDDEWIVLHADIPLVEPRDLAAVLRTPGEVLVPAHDGGTNVIKGFGSFPFSYGPASFHRHLARRPMARVVSTAGLALDLDTPRDLETARRLAAGAWLEDIVAVIPAGAS